MIVSLRLSIALTGVLAVPLVAAAQDAPASIRTAAACAPVPLGAPDDAPRVVAGQDPAPKALYGLRDLVVIDAGAERQVQAGQKFFVRRPMRAPDGTAPRAMDTAGWLSIVSVDARTAIARIDFACDGVVIGDHLEPYVAPELPPGVDRTDARGELDFSRSAVVRYGSNGRAMGAIGDFMIAGMGESQGVRPGDRFAVYRDVYKSTDIPMVAVGEAVVVSATPDNAVIRLTQARDAVFAGDLIVARARVASPEPPPAAAEQQAPADTGEGRAQAPVAPAPPPARSYAFEDVHFDFDRFTLRAEALTILDQAVAAVQQDPSLRLRIEGHTCNIGTAEYNLALGARRAQAVKDYLTSRGVQADRLTTVSYGEEQPAHDNAQEATRRLNRRAVLAVNLER